MKLLAMKNDNFSIIVEIECVQKRLFLKDVVKIKSFISDRRNKVRTWYTFPEHEIVDERTAFEIDCAIEYGGSV